MLSISTFFLCAFALLCLYWMFETIRSGHREHVRRRYSRRRFRPEAHRLYAIVAYVLLWCTIIIVTAMHLLVRHHEGSRTLLLIHVPCAIALLTLMTVMLFWENGMKHPHRHRSLAVAVIMLIPVVFGTGGALIKGL